eukprot:scaffold172735_cov35-Tisochrysis_lutea.AAC.4
MALGNRWGHASPSSQTHYDPSRKAAFVCAWPFDRSDALPVQIAITPPQPSCLPRRYAVTRHRPRWTLTLNDLSTNIKTLAQQLLLLVRLYLD